MLSRLLDGAAEAEVHAFEAVDRCCADARREHQDACEAADFHRGEALRSLMAGNLAAAISHARREGEADATRQSAWVSYREAFALLLALVQKTSDEVGHVVRDLAHAG